jgi:hypothetical protein
LAGDVWAAADAAVEVISTIRAAATRFIGHLPE